MAKCATSLKCISRHNIELEQYGHEHCRRVDGQRQHRVECDLGWNRT